MFFYLQGRDAGDQHIIDVVLKMLQGEKSLMNIYTVYREDYCIFLSSFLIVEK